MRGVLHVFLLGCVACLLARQVSADSNQDVEALLKRVQALEETNKALARRVEELEKKQPGQPAQPAAAETTAPVTPQAQQPSHHPPASETPKATAQTLRASWNDGLRFESEDGQFRLKVGGRVMFDAAHFECPDYWILGGPEIAEHDGTEFRRLRLRLSGDVYEDFLYKMEVDFAGNEVEIIDAFVGVKNLTYIGSARVGQFCEPFGLEALTSSSHITFMERSMATQALIPYRSRGAALNNAFFDQRLTLSAGVFNGGIEQDSYWSVTGRVTGLPLCANEGRQLLHLGFAISRRNPESDYELYARPGSHLADAHLNTGVLPANEVTVFGAEAALVLGPFSLQGECTRANLSFMPEKRTGALFGIESDYTLDDRSFDGYYVQASYFLTGEHRTYDKSAGAFDRIVPKKSFKLHGGGIGALEIAARYENLSLDDYDIVGGVVGGNARNVTAGVNWYMTPNARLMLNYVRSNVDQFAYEGDIDIIEARFQADF